MLAVAPRVICLDEPTAGVAQREAEAFGPLIMRVQQELDATLVVVEHDLPMILSISDRVYCLEAGAGDRRRHARARSATNPRVVASYLGTDERAIQRSNAPAQVAPTPTLIRRRRRPTSPPWCTARRWRPSTAVTAFQSPVSPMVESNSTSRNASSAAYLPLHSDAMSVAYELDRAEAVRPPSASS